MVSRMFTISRDLKNLSVKCNKTSFLIVCSKLSLIKIGYGSHVISNVYFYVPCQYNV